MNKMKWYLKILIALLVIVFSPLILVVVLSAFVAFLCEIPIEKRKYEKSRYFADVKQRFSLGCCSSPEYRFYNSAMRRCIPVQYVKQKSNGLEYFVFDDTVFLFPDFEQIDFDANDTGKNEWEVNYDGDWSSFDKAYSDLLAKLDENPELPVKILVERKMFTAPDLRELRIPDGIYLTREYESAFENEDSPVKMLLPQTIEELYEMMKQTPELCGCFELTEEGIDWQLYDDICVEIGLDPNDGYIGICKKLLGGVKSGITHWHPSDNEIYNDICRIGKRGSVLVLRTFMGSEAVLYMGNKEDCPYQKSKRYLFGKLYYLEAK